MHRLCLCLLPLLLIACGTAAAPAAPVPPASSARTATGLLAEFADTGLPVYRTPNKNLFPCSAGPGRTDYQEFMQSQLPFSSTNAVASYDTPQHAAVAREACVRTNTLLDVSAWRRDTVILIWSFSSNDPPTLWHPYFTVLQSPH